jgi:hypothetical protein
MPTTFDYVHVLGVVVTDLEAPRMPSVDLTAGWVVIRS